MFNPSPRTTRALATLGRLTLVLAVILVAVSCTTTNASPPGTTIVVVPKTAPGTTRPMGPRPVAGFETYCQSFYFEMVVLVDQYEILNSVDVEDPKAQPAKFVAQVQKSYQLLTDTAPPEAKADLEVINNHVRSATTVQGVTDWRALPEVAQANTRNQQWVVQKCGFDPSNLNSR